MWSHVYAWALQHLARDCSIKASIFLVFLGAQICIAVSVSHSSTRPSARPHALHGSYCALCGKTTEAMRMALSLGEVFLVVGAGKQILPDQVLCRCEARCLRARLLWQAAHS